jgi:hypothetical protein
LKLLVCGSRGIDDRKTLDEELDRYRLTSSDLIICGGAAGVDTNAILYATEHGILCEVIDPDFEKNGSRAPLLRDAEMAKMCDRCLAIWDGTSAGTGFTINEVRKLGKILRIVHA